jgi:hypothetical protein
MLKSNKKNLPFPCKFVLSTMRNTLPQNQGCGSRSGLDPDSIGSVDPDSDPGGQKVNFFLFNVLKCGMASFES